MVSGCSERVGLRGAGPGAGAVTLHHQPPTHPHPCGKWARDPQCHCYSLDCLSLFLLILLTTSFLCLTDQRLLHNLVTILVWPRMSENSQFLALHFIVLLQYYPTYMWGYVLTYYIARNFKCFSFYMHCTNAMKLWIHWKIHQDYTS